MALWEKRLHTPAVRASNFEGMNAAKVTTVTLKGLIREQYLRAERGAPRTRRWQEEEEEEQKTVNVS